MAKKRTGEPWMPAAEYGRSLPAFTVNLLVRDIPCAAAFYREVFEAEVIYSDPDFAALRVGPTDPATGRRTEFMLHADHTYEEHPWRPALDSGERRGLGAELRLFGVDPDRLAERASAAGAAVLHAPFERGHGWREVWVQDPDGYVWAAGRPVRG